MRVRGLVALLLVAGLLAGGGYYARRRLAAAAAQPAAPVYATAQVTRGPLVADVLGFGPLQPDFLAPLTAPTAGTVDQVFVHQGDVVHKGQVLAKLSNPELANRIQQDQVRLQKDLQALAAALGVPVDQALAASANVASIPVDAPQTGRVVKWHVAVGDSVHQGDTLAEIVDDSRVVIDTGLVPYDFQRAAVGDAVTVHFDDFAGEGVAGTITSISPNPVPDKGGFFVYPATITLVNPGLLQPGMQGEATIHTATGDYPLPKPVRITGYGQSTVVVSPVAGTVQGLAVQENGWVQKGQRLATLGGPDALTAVAQARAQVDADQTTLQEDQQTERQLTVTSDLDGTVGAWFVQPGQRVGQGQPLGTVFNSQSMNLTIQVSELQVANVQPGQQVIVTVPGLPGKTFRGRVTGVDTMGAVQNGLATFGVHIAVDATSGLRPGMTADARIVVQTVPDAVLVPVEAVIQQGSQAEVEVLRDGRPVAVPVTVGLVNDRYAQITSGLEPGETVITGMAQMPASPGASGPGELPPGKVPGPGPVPAAGSGGPALPVPAVGAAAPPPVTKAPAPQGR
jgi:HlyD family secretion protein